ncbi:nucleotidyltransferase family protein [Lacrimispora algidixylanolytica]|uniref:Nucleotidyltransferase n=1 Tax=Lacrimispora algidixylanolytica TaxID=94868 RepID=A0A419TBM8_9FIRM|nr:nucleotidyltransferase family protein [Lacrimispora algidixylanolytica]RKD34857.1 nucleotidyltransferase [Lacrimispora algidixylanolytica]
MQAVLLAGGLGTRLRSVVNDRPKPMALIEGKPFMEYVVLELIKHGVNEIIFAVGYKGSMVEEYFEDGSRWDIKVSYAYEEELLGTAGAIKNAGRLVTDDRFLALNADTFYQIDYERLTALSEERDLHMALVLREVSDVSRYGQAVLKDGWLKTFDEKIEEKSRGTINGGVYYLRRSLLDEIPEGKVSLEHDMIPKWILEEKRLGGFVNDGYFIDIGVPEDYYRFDEDVRKGTVII